MAGISTLILAVVLSLLGLKGFRKSGFPFAKNVTLHGPAARLAGAGILLLALPLWIYGGWEVAKTYSAVKEYLAKHVQKRQAELEIMEANRRSQQFMLGCQMFQLQNYEKALQLFALDRPGNKGDAALLMRSRCYRKLGKFEEAIAELDLLLATEGLLPEFVAQLYLERGYAHYRRTEYQPALEDFARAREAAPDSLAAQAALGYLGWIRATCPDGDLIQIAPVVDAAKRFALGIAQSNWIEMEQLAAMCARTEQWKTARRAQQFALEGLAATKEKLPPEVKQKLQQEYRRRLELYQKHEPYQESQPEIEMYPLGHGHGDYGG